MKKADRQKRQLVIDSCLSRMTEFQLQSQDMEFFEWVEELRELLVFVGENIE
jgi:hypothetical protein